MTIWKRLAPLALIAVVGVSSAACQSQVQRNGGAEAMVVSAGALLPVDAMGPDFFEEQDVRLTWGDREFRFRAVLQKRGPLMELIALDPHARPAFKISYEGDRVTMDTYTDRSFPFGPEYMIADVQKAFAQWPLDARLETDEDVVSVGALDGLRYQEVWRDGVVVERHFAREDLDESQTVVVEVEAVDADGRARSVRIANGWFGYTLHVTVLRRDLL